MSVSESWDWEDPQIPDDDLLYRTVPKKPSHMTRDLLTGEVRLQPGALSYGRADGLSVYREVLLRERCGTDVSALCKDWSTHGVAEFTASVVRRVAAGTVGVVNDPTDEPVIGPAHAAVRHKDRAEGHHKPTWNPIRAAIAAAARWIEHPETHGLD